MTKKQISDSVMELRNYHNKELEEIKAFQEAVISYIKKHSKKLSLVASEMSLLENINKIQICKNCGHVIRLSTERPEGLPSQYINANGSIMTLQESVLGERQKSQSELVFPDSLMDLKSVSQGKSVDKLIKPIPVPGTPSRRSYQKAMHGSIIQSTDNPIKLEYDHRENQENIVNESFVPGYSGFWDIPSKTSSIRVPARQEKSLELVRSPFQKEKTFNTEEKLPAISKPIETIDYIPDKNHIEEMKKDLKGSKQSYMNFLKNNAKEYAKDRTDMLMNTYSKRTERVLNRVLNDKLIDKGYGIKDEMMRSQTPKIYRPPKETHTIKNYLEKIEKEAEEYAKEKMRKPKISSTPQNLNKSLAQDDKKDPFLGDLMKKTHVNQFLINNPPKNNIFDNKNAIYRPSRIPTELLNKPFQVPADKDAIKQNQLSEIISNMPEDKTPKRPPDDNKYVRVMMNHVRRNMNNLKKAEEAADQLPQDPDREEYVLKLIVQKPWLTKAILKPYKLPALKHSFPIDENKRFITDNELNEIEREVRFIKEKVEPFREKPREVKTDLELSYDMRYYNKYGDFLIKRVFQKNYYERLDLKQTCSENEIRMAYKTKALLWHPDNIKKNYSACFANETEYQAIITQIFSMIDEAYKTLSSPEKRKVYDAGLHHH